MTKKKSSSHSRRFFFLMILAVFAVTAVFYLKKESIVRQVVQQELAGRFPEYQIQVAGVRTHESKGVLLYGLQISVPGKDGKRTPLAEAEEVFIQTPITLNAWLQGKITLQGITITRPAVRLNSRTIAAFRSFTPHLKDSSQITPIPVKIRNGSVAVTSSRESEQAAPLTIVYSGIDITLTPPLREKTPDESPPLESPPGESQSDPTEDLPRLSLVSDPGEQQLPSGSQKISEDQRWQIEGKCRNPYVKELKVSGNFSSDLRFFSLSGTAEALEAVPQITAPFVNPAAAAKLESFQGRSTFSFSLSRDLSISPDLQYSFDGELYQGSFTSPVFNRPISDIFAKYQISNSGTKIERLTARNGSGIILSEYERTGRGKEMKQHLKLQLDEFQLTNEILSRIPVRTIQDKLALFSNLTFSATAKLNLELYGNGNKFDLPELGVRCKDISLSHPSLPFRPGQLEGGLKLEKTGRLRFLFKSAEQKEQNLQISGELPDILQSSAGKTIVQMSRIPLDAQFLESIPEKYRKIIASLHPAGLLSGTSEFSFDEAGINPEDIQISIDLEEGSINYDHFPYPISGIKGKINYTNGNWSFTDFEGTNSSTAVTALGHAKSGPDAKEFQIDIQAKRFPLGDEFRNALCNPNHKEIIERVHLRGMADASIRIALDPQKDQVGFTFDASLIPEETSIQPDPFPYLLNTLSGTVHYEKGRITIKDLRGEHGTMTLLASVAAELTPNGGIGLQIAPLTIDQLQIDRELQNAVPSSLLRLVEEFSPSGFFNAEGGIKWRQISTNAPIEFAWDANILLHNNSVKYVKDITGICGKLLTRGYTDGTTSAIHGQLNLNSLCIGSVQATQITGPFYADKTQVLFGNAVPQIPSIPLYRQPLLRDLLLAAAENEQAARNSQLFGITGPVSASIFHGKTDINAIVTLSPQSSFQLEFNLQDGQLDELIRDLNEKAQRLDGQVSIFANIQGEGKNLETAKGNGGMTIKNASLYELPVMMQVFKSFSVNEPDRAAFDTSFVDFQIYGNRLKLDRVLLEGDSLTLFGDGWLSLEGGEPAIDLTLNSRLSRVRNQVPLLSDLIGSAGDQIAQIKVEGPLSEASVRQDSFPGIKKAVWSIFSNKEGQSSH